MVPTKWYGQIGIRTKWYRTKWHGQTITDKMVRIKQYLQNHQSRNPAFTGNITFFINPASTLTPLGFLCVFIT